jgi:DNA-binding response OmpR family regulator
MNKKILLIEDDPFISEIYNKKLTESFFEVKLVKSGEDALDSFRDFKPDLVILDIMLPKKDGWEILEEFKKEKINSKIIMLTNLSDKEKISKAFNMGVDDYIVKASLTPSELIEVVKEKLKIKTKNE